MTEDKGTYCKCAKPLRSGRYYFSWKMWGGEACNLCLKLIPRTRFGNFKTLDFKEK
jgi:hypothetical protein